jgi:hypothetical protein
MADVVEQRGEAGELDEAGEVVAGETEAMGEALGHATRDVHRADGLEIAVVDRAREDVLAKAELAAPRAGAARAACR